MKPTFKQPTRVIDYNSNLDSDFDNDVKFADINLLCNKLRVQLLANDLITCTKKIRILETEDETNKPLKAKIT